MSQNPTVDNDLQKAIDDITKSTNMDPVFADPVAAPVMEEVEAFSASVTPPPRPMPRVNVPVAQSMPMPPEVAPVQPAPVANMPAPTPEMSVPAPAVTPRSEPVQPVSVAAEQILPEPMVSTPVEPVSAPVVSPVEPVMAETVVGASVSMSGMLSDTSLKEVKDAALRDLLPLMDKISLDPSQKFDIYKNVIDDLGDNTVISSAYDSAREIADESERGEALLYLIKSIDKM